MLITDGDPLDSDALRIRHEFLSAPDVCLSVNDVVLQQGVQPRHALLILESLVWEGFLARLPDGRYVRASRGCDAASLTGER